MVSWTGLMVGIVGLKRYIVRTIVLANIPSDVSDLKYVFLEQLRDMGAGVLRHSYPQLFVLISLTRYDKMLTWGNKEQLNL